MALLEEVVTRCTEVEQHLRALGATGSGLAELIESIEKKLKPETMGQVRNLASVRNRFVHEYGYVYSDSSTELLTSADALLTELRTLADETIAGNRQSKDTDLANFHQSVFTVEHPMSEVNPWVEIISADSQPKFLRLRIPSTPTLRLVFFRGVFPDVPPLGKHLVPLLGVSKLARVSMAPQVTKFAVMAATRDQIEVGLNIDVTAQVNPTDHAIARIASDAIASAGKEVRLLETNIARNLQRIVSVLRFEDLPDTSALQVNLAESLTRPNEEDLALRIVSLSVRSFGPINPEIRAHHLERLRLQKRAVLGLEEEAAERRRLEIERVNAAWKIKEQRQASEWDREQAKLRAQDQNEIEQARHSRDLEIRQMELQAQIRIAEVQRDAEIAKASRSSLDQVMPMIIKGAMGEGERRLLADIIRKQIGVSVGLTSVEPPDSSAASQQTTQDKPAPQNSDHDPDK